MTHKTHPRLRRIVMRGGILYFLAFLVAVACLTVVDSVPAMVCIVVAAALLPFGYLFVTGLRLPKDTAVCEQNS